MRTALVPLRVLQLSCLRSTSTKSSAAGMGERGGGGRHGQVQTEHLPPAERPWYAGLDKTPSSMCSSALRLEGPSDVQIPQQCGTRAYCRCGESVPTTSPQTRRNRRSWHQPGCCGLKFPISLGDSREYRQSETPGQHIAAVVNVPTRGGRRIQGLDKSPPSDPPVLQSFPYKVWWGEELSRAAWKTQTLVTSQDSFDNVSNIQEALNRLVFCSIC